MTYKTPNKFNSLPSIKINSYWAEKNPFEVIVEVIFLGQFELAGYYNRVGAKSRIITALIQCTWSSAALFAIGSTLDHYEIIRSNSESIVSICAVIGAIFGATYFREMKDIHNKWEYLSATFNEIVKVPPIRHGLRKYNQREHLAACLAHDLLTMNMWAHRSFRSFFKEIVEKAIIHESSGDISNAIERLTSIAESGINYKDVKELISNYLEAQRPESDKPGVAFLKIVSEPSAV